MPSLETDDILTDTRYLYGDGGDAEEPEYIEYGEIRLWIAPKVSGALTRVLRMTWNPSALYL